MFAAQESMASSSNPNATDEMDQLVALQRSGILSMSEFLRMSREISKTHAEHLAEARASSPQTSESDMMVDETGNVFEAAEAATLDEVLGVEGSGSAANEGDAASAASKSSGAGSFDDTPDDDMHDEEDEEQPPILESNTEFEFEVGAPVIVRRGGHWSGTVTAIGSDPDNFLTLGKYQVRYEALTKKGRGFTRTMVHAWVQADALKKRVVSPRKAQRTDAEGDDSATRRASSKAVHRPHLRQPDMEEAEDDGHPAMAAHERGRKLKHNEKPA